MRTDIIKFLTLEETTRLLPELASNRRDQAGRDDPAQRLQGEFKAEGKVRTLAEIKPFLLGGAEPPSQEEVAIRQAIPFATLRTVLRRNSRSRRNPR